MNWLVQSIRKPFDYLYSITSDEIVQDSPYDSTRSDEGIYSITNTQSSHSTYAADETRSEDETADRRSNIVQSSDKQNDGDSASDTLL